MKKFLLALFALCYCTSSSPNVIDDIVKDITLSHNIYDINNSLSKKFDDVVRAFYLQSWTQEEDNKIKNSLKNMKEITQKKASQTKEPWGVILTQALQFCKQRSPLELCSAYRRLEAPFTNAREQFLLDTIEREQERSITAALSIASLLKEITHIAQPMVILTGITQKIPQPVNTSKEPSKLDRQLKIYKVNPQVCSDIITTRLIREGCRYNLPGLIADKKKFAQNLMRHMLHLSGINIDGLINLVDQNSNAQTNHDCNNIINRLRTLLNTRQSTLALS